MSTRCTICSIGVSTIGCAANSRRGGIVLDEFRQRDAGGCLHVGEEGLGALLHQAVQRGLLGAARLIVNSGASGRRLGPPGDGLHALLTFRPLGFMV